MKVLNANDALNKIMQAGPEFLMDADDLNYLIEEEEAVTCYEDANSILYINKDKDTDYVYSIYRIKHWGEIINVINEIERKNKEWEKE